MHRLLRIAGVRHSGKISILLLALLIAAMSSAFIPAQGTANAASSATETQAGKSKIFVPMARSIRASTTPPPTETGKGALYLSKAIKTASASSEVDAAGGMHAAFVHFVPLADHPAAVYGVCSPGGDRCGSAANWQFVQLTDRAEEVQLALTPAGQPRLLIVGDSVLYPGGKDYIYAACDLGCTSAANWATERVFSSDGTAIFDVSDQHEPQHYFALDPQGRPRFVYQDRNYGIEPDHYGAFYAYCDAGCTDANNWQQTQVGRWIVGTGNYEIFHNTSLTFTSDGRPRLTANVLAMNEDGSEAPSGLYYYGCDANCDQTSGWQRLFLIPSGGGSYPNPSWDIELDANNRPRIVAFTGDGLTPNELNHRLLYLWCNSNCFSGDGWYFAPIGTQGDGESADLEIDAQGHPRTVWVSDDGEIGYAACDVGCESDNGQWRVKTLETAAAMEQANPQAIPANCDQALWQAIAPTLALDSAGNPRIAYDVQVDARCYYADPNDPQNPTYHFERVWNGVRWLFVPKQ